MLQFKKSSNPDFLNYKHIELQLDLLLKEQRNQRLDLANINALIKSIIANSGVQKQVTDFYQSEDDKNIPEEET